MKDQKDQTFNPYIRMAYEDRHMSTSKYNLMLFVSFFDFANNSLVVYTTRERSHTHTRFHSWDGVFFSSDEYLKPLDLRKQIQIRQQSM